MTKDVLRKFKKLFTTQKKQIEQQHRVIYEDFSISPDDRYDEIDQASTDIEQSMRMRLTSRNTLYIKKLNDALQRIEEGTFGECIECSEDIELRRLEARPTATLCVFCKEEQERREVLVSPGRRTIGAKELFSRKYA